MIYRGFQIARPGTILILGLAYLFPNSTLRLEAVEPRVDFARDIRPVLSDKCFKCHGPDAATREAGLRLDTLEGMTADLGGYAAVVPGDAERSELLRRVLTHDADEVMPPPEANKSLDATQKNLIRLWIEQGADWEQHWSFIPPRSFTPPKIELEDSSQLGDWCVNEIDAFILSAMQAHALHPAADAEPETLIRRVYLDLIGLPPTPAEMDRWLAKIRPHPKQTDRGKASFNEAAYQRLITYLLASPHYGEHWARRWLDLARYADTNGYEKDRERSIWPYRDWVVNALNQDMPFDQFTIEQLAGDILPSATIEQRIATGFHRNTMLNEEGGIDPLEFRFHAMTDRVATTGTTWLGLTLGCCQCHTHKYDPVTHTEYYQLMALLNNADEPYLELPSLIDGGDFEEVWSKNKTRAQRLVAELPQRWLEIQQPNSTPQPVQQRGKAANNLPTETPPNEMPRISTGKEAVESAAAEDKLRHAFLSWLELEQANHADWSALHPVRATANLPILTIQEDDSIFASGDTAKRDIYQVEFAACDHKITALQLEALPDERLPARGPGSTYYEGTLGDFYLVEFEVTSNGQPVEIKSASETYARNRYGTNPVSAQLTIDGDVQTGWSVHDRQGERHVAVYVLAEPIPAGQSLELTMTFGRHFASSLGRFRVRATDAAGTPQARDMSAATSRLLGKTTVASVKAGGIPPALLEEFLFSEPKLQKYADEIRGLRRRPQVPTTLVLAERPPEHPRPTYRHHRGEYLQPKEEVAAGVPEVLPPLDDHQAPDRLSFARWLVSDTNPLTARVVVNRQWAHFFGTGIVETVDDFGVQGAAPSHPELLDWLALQFMQQDQWSLKNLHRRIVSSRTYRQSSRIDPKKLRTDPDNRWLSYAPRFRLEAEVLRDSLLVASGAWQPELGGPPVHPPQAAGITELSFGRPTWKASQGAERFRRSLYTFIKRTAPFAMFATFDAPSGEACIARRTRSNSPLQALTLLNDVMLVELARLAGRRFAGQFPAEDPPAEFPLADARDNAKVSPANVLNDRLEAMFRAVLIRRPTAEELTLLRDFFDSQVQRFRQHPDQARQLVDGDLATATNQAIPDDGPAGERLALMAAWTASARALFALDETQTRQ